MTSMSKDKAQKKEHLLKRAQAGAEGQVWIGFGMIRSLVSSNSDKIEIEVGRDLCH